MVSPFRFLLYGSLISLLFLSCGYRETADLIIMNADILTMDTSMPNAEALAIKDGKLLFVGPDSEALIYEGSETATLNLNGQFLMPGLIEGHGHYSGLGFYLQNLQLVDVRSWEATMDLVESASRKVPPGTWIYGRGWHQEKWDSIPGENVLGYPFHHELSRRVPDHPVMLTHASGHAIFANKYAMDLANVGPETPNPSGGRIVIDASGDPIGVFEENAENIITWHYHNYLDSLEPEVYYSLWKQGIQNAQANCLKHGITTFVDAGTDLEELALYQRLADQEGLDVRLYMMLRDSISRLKSSIDGFPMIGAYDGYLTVRAIKEYLDGALGSRGAWLLEPYTDEPINTGQTIMTLDSLQKSASFAADHGMQLCVHAIGDRANRELLDLFSSILGEDMKNKDLRWRIEHAQHIQPEDIARFSEMGVIPAMQAIHCTSDAPFVIPRLGYERAKNTSYSWRSLIDSGSIIANGTDTPVEPIDPFASIYASVTRKKNPNTEPFFPEQSMSRQEALLSYTLWNAYAAFEEDVKGSLEVGKMADFVVLSNNLLTCPDDSIPSTKVVATYVNGQKKFPIE